MFSKDHRLLGNMLAEQMIKRDSSLATRLFVTGCVFPDHNPWTYIKGTCKGHPLKSHFIFSTRFKIESLLNKLENKSTLRIKDYYILGELVHYTADAFTFSHNDHYIGNMLKHAEYEHIHLHEAFEENCCDEIDKNLCLEKDSRPLETIFTELPQSYLEEDMEPMIDVKYICQICTTVCARILEKEEVAYA